MTFLSPSSGIRRTPPTVRSPLFHPPDTALLQPAFAAAAELEVPSLDAPSLDCPSLDAVSLDPVSLEVASLDG
ncbi:MAG TPA: hypothetical protein VEV38_06255 [Candidatus Eremiobacteraceae bacterium]|nr:hypothetical protein [Candidatus Eremiobacteraceae bacterium]